LRAFVPARRDAPNANVSRCQAGRVRYTVLVTKFESVLTQAMELDEDERQLLAIRLGMSIGDEKEPGYDEAWSAEIKRRLEEIDRGDADLVDWEEAEKLIFDD
jgi:hypothetical protein